MTELQAVDPNTVLLDSLKTHPARGLFFADPVKDDALELRLMAGASLAIRQLAARRVASLAMKQSWQLAER